MMQDWNKIVFADNINFSEKGRQIFEYQFENNPVYRRFCETLGPEPNPDDPPLLPIRAFKDTEVTTGSDAEADLVFKSSGTSDLQRSVHYVQDATLYEQSLLKGFKRFFKLDKAVIWGYMPGYEENPHSSLIYMVRKLVEQDESSLSRFLPLDKPLAVNAVREVERQGKQLILFGAAFGLLDLLEMSDLELPSNSVIIETGGMKTHRREISREELHRRLAKGFGLHNNRIFSEYGMAELLSQAYTTGGKWFQTVPWMQVSIRNPDNPQQKQPPLREGLIGVIDLANVHSCSFLLTGDRGIMDKNGRFQVLGRWNPKDLRGCNFLVEED